MLARVLAMALYPYVCLCLSVTSRSSAETDERIELVFGMGASFHPSYTVKGKFGYLQKISVLHSGTLSQTPDLENYGISIFD